MVWRWIVQSTVLSVAKLPLHACCDVRLVVSCRSFPTLCCFWFVVIVGVCFAMNEWTCMPFMYFCRVLCYNAFVPTSVSTHASSLPPCLPMHRSYACALPCIVSCLRYRLCVSMYHENRSIRLLCFPFSGTSINQRVNVTNFGHLALKYVSACDLSVAWW